QPRKMKQLTRSRPGNRYLSYFCVVTYQRSSAAGEAQIELHAVTPVFQREIERDDCVFRDRANCTSATVAQKDGGHERTFYPRIARLHLKLFFCYNKKSQSRPILG